MCGKAAAEAILAVKEMEKLSCLKNRDSVVLKAHQ